LEEDILEHITRNQYSISLDETIFENTDEDEIVLCLNYDDLYLINNINRFLQNSNTNVLLNGVYIHTMLTTQLFLMK
jgi:hypothetical protein